MRRQTANQWQLIINGRPFRRPNFDYQLAVDNFWCFPGKSIFVVPRQVDQNRRESGLLLADRTADRLRLPVAVCVAAHRDTGLIPGQVYIVNQKWAKRVKNVNIGKLQFNEDDGEMWLFGCTANARGLFDIVPPSKYVYAWVDTPGPILKRDQGAPWPMDDVQADRVGAGHIYLRVGQKVKARGKVALHLGERAYTSIGGIDLVNSMRERADISLVESVSDRCFKARPGMYVWYMRRALTGLAHDGDDFGCIGEDAIYAAVNLHGLA